MPNPQQPELRRSGRGATTDDSAEIAPDNESSGRSSGLPERTVPDENRPGHHPEVEQDHPAADRLPDARRDDDR
jgi:hypothetical protein